ncbi:MAG: DUF4924 family protein [Bacteroidales bacterium]|nr:DUF4924 family protein [Bacteroidales bacterium]
MLIAQTLRKKNIAEYLLYMWQVEDLIRANGCVLENLEKDIISKYPESQQESVRKWYSNLIDMMRTEGVTEKGHLQVNKNVLLELIDLHAQLLAVTKFPFYNAAYFKALPFIVELRQKSANKEEPELETCFNALYGVWLLRLKHQEISADTQQAMKHISSFISLLANYYQKDQQGELDFD